MKLFKRLASLLLLAAGGLALPASAQQACPALLDYKMDRLQDEQPQNLCQYAGNVVLVVNTASYCGFTVQYEGLEKLYAKYRSQGLVVLGFASNDFGQQEPGANSEIADFCYNTYGVKFPMFAKSSVQGSGASPFYTGLIKASGLPPRWNFHKYLLDRNGKLAGTYASKITPEDTKLVGDIEKALRQKP